MTSVGHGGPAVRLRGLVKRFGAVEAVAGVDLDVAGGAFFSMLGPSGSGKTTVLRMIAGFEQPTAGSVSRSRVRSWCAPPSCCSTSHLVRST